jgi:hypothetical protein
VTRKRGSNPGSTPFLFWERDAKNMPAPLFRLILSDIRELITAF